ncbi:hypothetical protein Psi01_46610 [Planobispora siamensis]|uniref:Uncharacterized protein n=1 Tax=Planobispora siamensis TaxID=936338 RepID=A0A8J3SGA4_9ACTN|nr:hypothetical protein Psi01_46610 [Planobispora siamensis]
MNPSAESRQTATATRWNVGDAGDAAATNSPLLQPTGLADGFGLEEVLPHAWFTPIAVVPRFLGKVPKIRHIGC